MGSWPFTRLHFGCGRCVAISGPHIQVFDATSGQTLAATRCANAISCSAVDERYVHIVTTGDDKKLSVWELSNLQLKSSRELPKKATVVEISRDGKTILVADKFGDVFSYPIDPVTADTSVPAQSSGPRPKESQASHENPHGSLVLGHASIITSFRLSHDGRYIITADRDEHIRVSRYPNGYNIERYCLGHQLFISTICVPAFDPSSLISGGGDPSMKIWDWMSGDLKFHIPVADTVRPFLKVRERRNKWHGGQGMSGGARGRKRKTSEERAKGISDKAIMESHESNKPSVDIASAQCTSEEDPVFALAKVEAFEFNAEKLLIFSAIGGSALFYCIYPSEEASDIPSMAYIDFATPVLDFVLGGGCQVLVSVDAAWPSPPPQEGDSGTAVRLIEWVAGEFKFVETSPLLTSMNGVGSKAASSAELKSLNLYSDLVLLPKNASGPEEGDGTGDQDSDMRTEIPMDSQGDGKEQHSKVVGRHKTKQALLRKQLDKSSSRSVSDGERESKKIKLDP
ncbi:WD40-repeat-containing domain protein [Gautieria morchelliformis]|nr:WD40-repeat-containing domain protein [Gautieria morchelliformis]